VFQRFEKVVVGRRRPGAPPGLRRGRGTLACPPEPCRLSEANALVLRAGPRSAAGHVHQTCGEVRRGHRCGQEGVEQIRLTAAEARVQPRELGQRHSERGHAVQRSNVEQGSARRPEYHPGPVAAGSSSAGPLAADTLSTGSGAALPSSTSPRYRLASSPGCGRTRSLSPAAATAGHLVRVPQVRLLREQPTPPTAPYPLERSPSADGGEASVEPGCDLSHWRVRGTGERRDRRLTAGDHQMNR